MASTTTTLTLDINSVQENTVASATRRVVGDYSRVKCKRGAGWSRLRRALLNSSLYAGIVVALVASRASSLVAVEYARSKEMVFATGSLVVAWPVDNEVNNDTTEGQLQQSYELLIHFHGNPDTVIREATRAEMSMPLAVVNFPGLSSAYRIPFEQEETRFEELLQQTAKELRRQRRFSESAQPKSIVLSSFSAGYGAVREIIKSPSNVARIDGYIAADSIYASIVKPSENIESVASERVVDSGHMKDFTRLAQLAQQGNKFFLITHSAQFTPYASTTETADYLIHTLGITRVAHEKKHTHQLPTSARWSPTTIATQQAFVALGFDGTDAEAHLQHLRNIGETWRRIPQLRASMREQASRPAATQLREPNG